MANQVTLTFAGEKSKLDRVMKSVIGDAGKLDRSVTASSQRLAGAVGKFAKFAALGAAAGVVALGAFGLSAIEAGEALNSIRSQSAAVIESTGGVANVSAGHVQELADKLSNLAAVDRKLIENSENVLLTFTKVRNEVGAGNDIFDQGTLAALNMSAALGTDLQSATTMVGKALNDPVAGINAMSRAGIQFTEQQKEQIKTLTESGDILGAQKIILGELETQFGGAAAANADASDKIKLAFQKIQEEIGLKLLPYLDIFADWILNTGIPALEDFGRWIGDEVVPKLQDLGTWLGDNVLPVLQSFGGWLTETGVPALQSFAQFLSENTDMILAAGIGIAAVLVPAFIAWAVAAGAAAISTLIAMAPLILIGAAVAVLAYLIITHWDWIKEKTSAVWNAVKGFLTGAWNAISSVVSTQVNAVKAVVTGVWNGIKAVTSTVWSGITSSIRTQINIVRGIFNAFRSVTASIFRAIGNAITAPIRGALNGIRSAWNNTIGGKGISIPSVMGFGGASFTIPRLAHGGIVRARPGGTLVQAGEAGRDEAVIPLKPGMKGGMGGGTIVIRSSGAPLDDLLLAILRPAIENRGGVDVVFSGGR